tara:strand:+ start:29 stop:643 length:615 start_codon:yes stop_codon:yes gene_type:complete
MKTQLSKITNRLETIAQKVNKELFKNEIKDRIIFNVQSKGRRNCYGWLTLQKVWKVNGKKKEEFREINICSEFLDDSKQVVSTLIHEMVHAYNAERNISDCATNGYHNKKFGNKAESIGFKVEHSKRHGYAHTSIIPKSNLDKFVLSLNLKKNDFELARIQGATKKAKTKLKKWSCDCGMNVYCARELNSNCNDCGSKFEFDTN